MSQFLTSSRVIDYWDIGYSEVFYSHLTISLLLNISTAEQYKNNQSNTIQYSVAT